MTLRKFLYWLAPILVFAVGFWLIVAHCSGCYTGSPPWPYDPTQPAGIPRVRPIIEVNPYYPPPDASVDVAVYYQLSRR